MSLVIGGGIGASVIALANSSSFALFHLPARFGPCFDFGAFTFELLGGPALFAAKAAFGAFEGLAEVGARF